MTRLGSEPARVVDVGSGSGALAVAIALRAPNAEVWATDLFEAAVKLTRANVGATGSVAVSTSCRATCSRPCRESSTS